MSLWGLSDFGTHKSKALRPSEDEVADLAGIDSVLGVALPAIYFSFALLVFTVWPFISIIHCCMDIILLAINGIVCWIALLATMSLPINETTVMSVLGIGLAVLPVAFVLLLLCCRKKLFRANDLTLIKPLDNNECERRNNIIEKTEAKPDKRETRAAQLTTKKTEPTASEDTQTTADTGNLHAPLTAEAANDYRKERRARFEAGEEIELEDLEEYKWEFIFKEDDITVSTRDFASIFEFSKIPEQRLGVSQRKLSYGITMMYRMLDCVLDGAPIARILSTLRIAIMIACVAFGWYIGVLLGQDTVETFYDDYGCGCADY
jgi:hypothetical protein